MAAIVLPIKKWGISHDMAIIWPFNGMVLTTSAMGYSWATAARREGTWSRGDRSEAGQWGMRAVHGKSHSAIVGKMMTHH